MFKEAEISERIRPADNDKVIIKRYPNSFLETDLDEYLKSIPIDIIVQINSGLSDLRREK